MGRKPTEDTLTAASLKQVAHHEFAPPVGGPAVFFFISPRPLPSRVVSPLLHRSQILAEHAGKCKGKCKTASPHTSALCDEPGQLIALCAAANAFRSAKQQLAAPSSHDVASGSTYPRLALNAVAAGFVAANGAISDGNAISFRWV